MRYLANAFSASMLPFNSEGDLAWLTAYRYAEADLRALLAGGFVSCVGHEATATVLAQRLGVPVPVNRISITLQERDEVFVVQLPGRLPEGRVLNAEEIQALDIRYIGIRLHAINPREARS